MIAYKKLFVLFTLSLLCNSVALFSEEDEFADFDDFDEFADLKVDEPEEPKGPLQQVINNTSGTLRTRLTYFVDHPEYRSNIDSSKAVAETRLDLSSYYTKENYSLNSSLWVEYGTQNETYRGTHAFNTNSDMFERPILELNELYGSVNFDNFDFTVGKKIFSNGTSVLYSPADMFKPLDLTDPFDFKEYGVFQINSDYYYKNVTLTTTLFPIPSTFINPASNSRWMDNRAAASTAGLDEDFLNKSIENMGYFVRGKSVVNGWDLFLAAYTGPGSYRVVEFIPGVTPKPLRKTPLTTQVTGGFSTTYNKWEFHGEYLGSWAKGGVDDSYRVGIGGFTYTVDDYAKKLLLDQIEITIEYSQESVMSRQDASNYITSSAPNRVGQRNIFTRTNFKYNEDLSFEHFGVFDLKKHSKYNRLSTVYRIRSGLTFTCGLDLFYGENDGTSSDFGFTNLGRWAKNDRFFTELEFSF